MNYYVHNQVQALSFDVQATIHRWCIEGSSTKIHPGIYNLKHEILKLIFMQCWSNLLSTFHACYAAESGKRDEKISYAGSELIICSCIKQSLWSVQCLHSRVGAATLCICWQWRWRKTELKIPLNFNAFHIANSSREILPFFRADTLVP